MVDATKNAAETLASQELCTQYSYEDHIAKPLCKHLQDERARRGISEKDWKLRFSVVDREGFPLSVPLTDTLTECLFPLMLMLQAQGNMRRLSRSINDVVGCKSVTSSSYFPPPESLLQHPGIDDIRESTNSNAWTTVDGDSEDEGHHSMEVRRMSTHMSFCTFKGSVGTGLVWHAKIMADDFEIKPRRGMPVITVSQLYEGLQLINGRWVLLKPLNGWPAMANLELKSLTKKGGGMMQKVQRLWDSGNEAVAAALPSKSTIPKGARATFTAPAWTLKGWSADSPGFVWWFSQHTGEVPSLIHGEKMIDYLEEGPYASAWATKAHAFAHRYPVEKETLKDTQTWHSGILIEWSHGKFTTLVELAWMNGCSGYSGRSNWCEDKLETPTRLSAAMPEGMICPWDSGKSELRTYDMPFRSQKDLMLYMEKYSREGDLPNEEHRFLNPVVYDSGDVRLRKCTPSAFAGFLLNYIHQNWEYVEWTPTRAQNCQTFAADLFSFLTGKRESKPYGSLIQAAYHQRSYSFLYQPPLPKDVSYAENDDFTEVAPTSIRRLLTYPSGMLGMTVTEHVDSESEVLLSWRYNDLNALAAMDPLRWSSKKSVKASLSEIQAQNKNFARPVRVREHNGGIETDKYEASSLQELKDHFLQLEPQPMKLGSWDTFTRPTSEASPAHGSLAPPAAELSFGPSMSELGFFTTDAPVGHRDSMESLQSFISPGAQ